MEALTPAVARNARRARTGLFPVSEFDYDDYDFDSLPTTRPAGAAAGNCQHPPLVFRHAR